MVITTRRRVWEGLTPRARDLAHVEFVRRYGRDPRPQQSLADLYRLLADLPAAARPRDVAGGDRGRGEDLSRSVPDWKSLAAGEGRD